MSVLKDKVMGLYGSCRHRLGKMLRRKRSYKSIRLSEDDVRQEAYKELLGGGREEWETRGAFQLHLLTSMGLSRSHRLLDVGCGPLRAGEHFIRMLDEGRYFGIDYNPDFIRLARQIVDSHADLAAKKPQLESIDGFEVSRLNRRFDYVMVFSVLNHCDRSQKDLFFRRIGQVLAPDAKVYVTHAKWFGDHFLAESGLKLTKVFARAEDIAPTLDVNRWGWRHGESVHLFPILQFSPADARETGT